MPESDLELLIAAARTAGDIALGFSRDALDVVHKSDDAGPVTKADFAVNDHLHDVLRTARPEYGWLSEESADTPDRLTKDTVFIVDPIDGTRSYIAGEKTWSHSLAVARNGTVTAAVVFLPSMNRMYAAAKGRGAFLNDTRIRTAQAEDLTKSRVLTTKPNLDGQHWRDQPPGFKRSHRPSIAYRLGLVAEGAYDAMFTFRPSWEWDVAAGALLVEEAGATISDRAGGPLRFNNPHPQTAGLISASKPLHGDILRRLTYFEETA